MDDAKEYHGEENPSCCAGVSMSYIVAVNIFTLLMGLGIVGLGTFMYIQFTDTFRAIVSEDAVIATMVAGLIIALFSVVGIIGALKHNRIMLSAYLLVLIAMILAQVAGSVLSLTYLGIIDNVTGAGSPAEQLTEDTAVTINNYFLQTYETCCLNNEELCSPALTPGELGYCTPVLLCTETQPGNATACYQDSVDAPDYPVENAVCLFFAEVQERDGFKLVGDPRNEHSCGGGNPKLYQRQLFEYIQDNFLFVAYGVMFFGLIELLLVIFTSFMLCTKRVKQLEDVDLYPFATAI